MKPLIWIIDEEWPDYEYEKEILKNKYPQCTLRFSTYDYAEDLINFGSNADAVICQVYADLPKSTIDQLQQCKIIAVYGGGYDRVDVKAAKVKGIKVTNVSGYCAEDLADYVIAAIYETNKGLATYGKAIEQGLWGAQAVNYPIRRIRDSVLLIIGCGRIGSTLARKAVALNMTVMAYDPYVEETVLKELGVTKVSLEVGLQKADYISINAILTEKTSGMITSKEFRQMKPNVVLINTARGKIIVEEDLIEAVQQGLIREAIVDVISSEPPTYEETIFKTEHIAVTPHISYISEDSFRELKRRACNNVITVLEGDLPQDWVNQ